MSGRYKAQGWFNESYRHSLAARGIRSFFAERQLKLGESIERSELPEGIGRGGKYLPEFSDVSREIYVFMFMVPATETTSGCARYLIYKGDSLMWNSKNNDDFPLSYTNNWEYRAPTEKELRSVVNKIAEAHDKKESEKKVLLEDYYVERYGTNILVDPWSSVLKERKEVGERA